MIELKQSTAVTLLIGPFVDSTDGDTDETGLTIAQADVRLSKNGGNMAQKNEATSCTHDELGYYTCPLNVTDTDTLGALKVIIHESGALHVREDCMVLTANQWDSKYSTDLLQTDLTQIGGVAQSATDLKDFADAGYDPSTNKITGCKLTDVNTDMVGTDDAALASELLKVPKSDSNVVWNATAQATIKTQVEASLDAVQTELASAPAYTGSIRNMIQWAFTVLKGHVLTTNTGISVKKADGSTELSASVLSDNGTTFDRSEFS